MTIQVTGKNLDVGEALRSYVQGRVGQTVEVIVDAVDADGAVARSTWDAPEIDGNVYLEGETGLRTGDLLKVVIEDSSEYDLWGRLARTPAAPARELPPSSPS